MRIEPKYEHSFLAENEQKLYQKVFPPKKKKVEKKKKKEKPLLNH